MSSQIAETRFPQWTLTDRLRKARELTGMEQTEFALELGVARSTVVRYERGHTKPQRAVLRAWAAVAGVSFDWLEGDPNPTFGGKLNSERKLPRADSNGQPAGYRRSTQSDQDVFRVYGSSRSAEQPACDLQAA